MGMPLNSTAEQVRSTKERTWVDEPLIVTWVAKRLPLFSHMNLRNMRNNGG
jgi:hypothetical protein